MLLHPFLDRGVLYPVPGTRLLTSDFGLIGSTTKDPENPSRVWTIDSLYTPINGRRIGGIRAKLTDQKGFVTFLNQRDLEVLFNFASVGSYCVWWGKNYVGYGDQDWFGLCADDDDLLDDLYDREMLIRAEAPQGSILPAGIEIERRVHHEEGIDTRELWTLLYDMDPETGVVPDCRLETIERRWSRIERERVRWERIY